VDPGTYTLQARVAGLHGGEFEVSLDGESLATVSVPETGGWQSWQTVSLEGVDVSTSGSAVLRVEALTDGVNLNWLEFVGQRPYGGTAQQIPGTIQAERFDEGGEGVAYHDTTEANRGGAFRTEEAVDIASADDASGEYNVGYFKSGEWLEYTVDVDPGTYTLQARVAGLHGGEFEVSLDGESLATVSVPETGGWQSWQTVSVDGVDVSQDGTAVLRIDVLDDGFNLNWLEFSSDADESYGKLGYGDAGYGGS